MANADLNVRLGLVTSDFERSLKGVEKRLAKFSRELDRAGNAITQSISAPLALVGGAALNSAAKFEQLEKALIAVTGSSEEANVQLLRLQKIAEAPGIGFNEAVAASLQFQGLGVSAAQAEDAITQVANVVAASGGGAQAFAGVVRQLNQIQAKNRVLQEDLNILLENAPVVGNVLQETFGAKTADAIREAGISGEQFFAQLIDGLRDVERVEQGLFNAFENSRIAIEFALARVGKAIDQAFDVQGILTTFVNRLNRVVDVFTQLDTGTQRTIIRFAAFAAASGPLLLLGSRIITIYGGVVNIFRSVTVSLISTVGQLEVLAKKGSAGPIILNKNIRNLTQSFKSLSIAQKATIVGLAVAVIGFAVNEYLKLRNAVDSVTRAQRALGEIQTEAEANIQGQLTRVDALIKVYSDETRSQKQRTNALKALQSEYPDYFKNLDIQTTKVKDLTAARNELSKSLLREAQITAATSKITENASKILDLKLKKDRETNNLAELRAKVEKRSQDAAQNALRGSGNFTGVETGAGVLAIETRIENITKEVAELEKLNQQYSELAVELETVSNMGPKVPPPINPSGDPSLTKSGPAFETVFQPNLLFDQPRDFLRPLDTILAIVSDRVRNFVPPVEESPIKKIFLPEDFNLLEELEREIGNAELFFETVGERFSDKFGSFGSILERTISLVDGALTPAFGKFFDTVAEGGVNAFGAIIDALKDLVKQLIVTVAQAALLATIFSIFGGGGFVNFGKLFKAGLSGGIGGILDLKLADGGVVTGPTTALIGEAGPEAVIPLSQLNSILGPNQVEVIGRIRGEDLYFLNKRASERLLRNRG